MKQLQTLSIVAPGFSGLNTQESGVTLGPSYAQVADNVVIDKLGRLGARKGWVSQTTTGVNQLAGKPLRFMLEHIDADDAATILSAGNDKVFKNGVGAVLTDIVPSGYTITDNDWSGANLNDTSLLVQDGFEPLVFTTNATKIAAMDAGGFGTTGLYRITDYTGSVQNYGSNYPHHAIAAYGRYWTHNGSTVYWSTDIADANFPCFCGGTSGSLNIASVLPQNIDDIVALAVHNDFLIIFCKHNVVVYSGASNPIGVSFQLADLITGVGCVSKNSIQATGNDLIFLSDTGVRSFGRLVQEKSLPLRDLTKNVRDDLVADMQAEIAAYLEEDPTAKTPLDHLASVYSEENAFYLLSFPSKSRVYVLDMRGQLEDGSARCTTWTGYEAASFLRTRDRVIYIGKTNTIGKYEGYLDNGSTYGVSFLSHYSDFGNSAMLKMVKQAKVTVQGTSGQDFVLKVGTDYNTIRTYGFNIEADTVYEYGVAEYGLSEYTSAFLVDSQKRSVFGSGNIIQVGFEAEINNSALSVQSLDVFVKTGRIG